MGMDSAVIVAILSALFGGAGLKIIEKMMNRSAEREDIASDLRNELRTDLTVMRTELANLESALDHLRNRYYVLVDIINHAKSMLFNHGLYDDAEAIQRRIDAMERDD